MTGDARAHPRRLSTQDLKERGWTPAMIRDLLGTHDATRANELRVGSRSRRVDAPVKLYLEDRVVQAEASERFARAQDAARARQGSAAQAASTREARQQAQIEAYVNAYSPSITPHPDAGTMTHTELWQHHLRDLDAWQFSAQADDLLTGLKGKHYRDAQNRLVTKHRQAVYAAYGWEDPQ